MSGTVVLLCHFDGSGTAAPVDAASIFTFGAGSANAQQSGTRPVFGTAAAELLVNGDYTASVPTAASLATGDWTIEGWLACDDVSSSRSAMVIQSASSPSFNRTCQITIFSGVLTFQAGAVGTGGGPYTINGPTVTASTVYAVSFERFGDTLYAYVNGALVGSLAMTAGDALPVSNPSPVLIFGGRGLYWPGMLDEWRITKGEALRAGASSYTVTTSAFPEPGNNASGFKPTQFGTPKLALRQPASGLLATGFGSPTLRNRQHATGLAPTHFGTPARPHTVTVYPSGFLASGFGQAVAFAFNPPVLTRIVRSLGFRPTRFGIPTVHRELTTSAGGWLGTNFGAPEARFADRVLAQGLDARAQFGTPVLQNRQRASGFKPTQLGAPALTMRFAVTALAPATRFGTPARTHPKAHCAYGWNAVRIGRPRLKTGTACQAGGFSAINFGVPAVKLPNRASSIPPATFFGTPQLQRNPRC